MSVRIRLKKMGRKHRPFFRLCAMDIRSPRDGRVLEELGYYDPMVADTDVRALIKGDRIDYWISVGAQPSDKAGVLIKKYGTNGTHLAAQKAALEKMKVSRAPKKAPIGYVPQKGAAKASEKGVESSVQEPAADAPVADAVVADTTVAE